MIADATIPARGLGLAHSRLGVRRMLWLVLGAYLLIATTWSLVVPLGEGPDETGHIGYALFLRAHSRLPVQAASGLHSDVPGEGHQPPLAYLLMQPLLLGLHPEQAVVDLPGNPNFRWNGGSDLNAYLHGPAEGPPYRGVYLAWHLLRLMSVLLGAASVAGCALVVHRLWPDRPALMLGAAALVAWNPQWIFHHALVSNDPLLIALATLLVLMAVEAARGTADSQRLPLAMGLTLGLMLLCKQSALALLPVPLLGVVLGARRPLVVLRHSALVLGVAGLVSGWWFMRNWRLYGDPLGLAVFHQTFAAGDFRLGDWRAWQQGGWNLLRSSVGAFGWMTVPLPDGAYVLARTLLWVGLAGLLTSSVTRLWQGRGRPLLVLASALVLVLLWTVFFALTAGAVAWQGRFLLPAAPALATLLAIGLASALPRRAALWLACGLCLILSAVLPWTLIRPAYATPAATAEDVPRGSIYVRFDPGWKRGLELHDASFGRVARADESLRIGLTWRLVEPVDRAWWVFVHLVDDEQIVARQDALPLQGRLLTNAWLPGAWYRDQHQLALHGVAPGTYRLRLGLFDPRTHERLAIYGDDNLLRGDYVDLGQIQVVAEGS